MHRRSRSRRRFGLGGAPLGADHFTSPTVAALPTAAAPPVLVYPGYADAKVLLKLPARSADLAIGPDGSLYTALMERRAG